jgi:hypothetical protein
MSRARSAGAPLPRLDGAVTVVEPPGPGPGFWAGAPSAVFADGTYHLAYRLRRPVGQGRGYAVVVASSGDGVEFEPVAMLDKADFGAESLERPALVAVPGRGWRLYVSCNTPGTDHWWVDALDADEPGGFDARHRQTVLPGDATVGVKDPVVIRQAERWHMWACCHPLAEPSETDRMVSRYAVSDDGLRWTWKATALAGRTGTWDQRGARITSVVGTPVGPVAYYDGRASAAENFEERTGVALGDGSGVFVADGATPALSSPEGGGALRYLSVVALPDGGYRLFYEASRADGAHRLCTEHVPAVGAPVRGSD